jgi:hypothetical protein
MRQLFSAIVLSVLFFVGCAHQPSAAGSLVSLNRPDGTRIATVAPMPGPYTQSGPTATAWLNGADARLGDGRLVSGIMFRAWLEPAGARVQVYAMTTKPGETERFTTEESALEELEIGSYLLRLNESAAIAEMAPMGVTPLMLRYGP